MAAGPVSIPHPGPRLVPMTGREPAGATTLPAALSTFIGRGAEVAAVTALLVRDDVRLVTLTGPGGVGKSRLALRVATDLVPTFTGEVWLVSLAPISDPDLVVATIAQALGIRQGGERSALDRLTAFLRPRTALLVLDNFEQVVEAGPIVADILASCPGLTILVTSRVRLRVSGEREFPVPPLGLPAADDPPSFDEVTSSEAIKLFSERAQNVKPDFALTLDNAAAVVGICRRLDGLPLAIELAAARISVLPPPALLLRLDRPDGTRLPLLTGGARDQPARLRTMRDAIGWSYNLLSPAEQALFRRLAVFVGGCTLEAAEAVARWHAQETSGRDERSRRLDAATTVDSSATLDLVASLVDHSLLRREDRPAPEGSPEPRFGMLETVREFGLEQLAARGEVGSVRGRHAAWYFALAKRVQRTGGLSQGRWLAVLAVEHPNLRAALAWLLAHGDPLTALRLAGILAEFWLRHGHFAEGVASLERALAADDGAPTTERAEALIGLSMVLWTFDHDRAARALAEAEAVAAAAGDARTRVRARLHQGYIALFHGNLDLAIARGEEVLPSFEETADDFNRDGALWLLARAALDRGDDDRATTLYKRLREAASRWGDDVSIANAHHGLATLADRRGETSQALAGFAAAAVAWRSFGDRLGACDSVDAAARAALALGRPEPAVRLLAVAVTLRRTLGEASVPLYTAERAAYDRALTRAREALGPERFGAAWAAGTALSFDDAIAELAALASPGTDDAPARRLTPREVDVLGLLVAGGSDKEIAAALFVSRRTASKHVAEILAKLNAPSRAAAAAIAVRNGLV